MSLFSSRFLQVVCLSLLSACLLIGIALARQGGTSTPTAIAVGNFGTYSSGSLSSVQTIDSNYYVVQSVSVSGPSQWADMVVDFSVSNPPAGVGLTFSFRGRSIPGKSVLMNIYNYQTSAWDYVKAWAVNGTDATYTFDIAAGQVASYRSTSGAMKVYLRCSGGTTPAAFYLDYASIVTLPAAPSNLQATAISSSTINLVWNDNSTDEDGFRIERKTGAGAYALVTTVPANTTSYLNNSGLSASTAYTYRVRANKGASFSAWSNEATATTLGPGQTLAPVYVSVYATSATSIRVYWTQVPTATAYKIYRATTSGGYNFSTPLTTINVVTGNEHFYDNSGLTTNQDYFYVVKAVVGGIETAASDEDSHYPNSEAVPWNGSSTSIVNRAITIASGTPGNSMAIPPGNTMVITPDNLAINDVSFLPTANLASWDPSENTMTSDGVTVTTMVDEDPSANGMSGMAAAKKAEGGYRKVTATPLLTPAVVGGSCTYFLPSTGPLNTSNFFLSATHESPHAYLGFTSTGAQTEGGLQFNRAIPGDPAHPNRWQAFLRIADGRKDEYGMSKKIGYNINGPSLWGDTSTGVYARVVLQVNLNSRMVTFNVFGGDTLGINFIRSYSIPMRQTYTKIGGTRALKNPLMRRIISLAQKPPTGASTTAFTNPPPSSWPNAYQITGSRFKGIGYQDGTLYSDFLSESWSGSPAFWTLFPYNSMPPARVSTVGGIETTNIVHTASGL